LLDDALTRPARNARRKKIIHPEDMPWEMARRAGWRIRTSSTSAARSFSNMRWCSTVRRSRVGASGWGREGQGAAAGELGGRDPDGRDEALRPRLGCDRYDRAAEGGDVSDRRQAAQPGARAAGASG